MPAQSPVRCRQPMWTSSNISTFQKKFDFTSSEQGMPTYTSLKADDEVLINIIEHFEADEDLTDDSTFQFLICEQCGFVQCEPGNWLTVRRSGNFVLFIPAFNDILEEPEFDYQPPYFFKTKGAFILTLQEFEKLKETVPAFNKIKDLKYLTGFEASALYKWDTPHRMFGEFPNFKSLRKDHILYTTEFDEQTVSTIILDKLKNLETANKVNLIPIENTETTISLFLDSNPTTEWKALCVTANDFELFIGDKYKVVTV
jgi:hypothetical protein